ncbi:MAG: hypothetical protein ABJA34_13365 [Pseudonocardiales bacterium]
MATAGSDESMLPSDRRDVVIRVASQDSLREVLRRPLDFGCRPVVNGTSDASFTVAAIVTDEVLTQLRSDGFDISVVESTMQRAEVGEGDRFAGGRTVPHGFAEKLEQAGRAAQ